MYSLIKLHTRGWVGSQIRLAACVSIGKYVAPQDGHKVARNMSNNL